MLPKYNGNCMPKELCYALNATNGTFESEEYTRLAPEWTKWVCYSIAVLRLVYFIFFHEAAKVGSFCWLWIKVIFNCSRCMKMGKKCLKDIQIPSIGDTECTIISFLDIGLWAFATFGITYDHQFVGSEPWCHRWQRGIVAFPVFVFRFFFVSMRYFHKEPIWRIKHSFQGV